MEYGLEKYSSFVPAAFNSPSSTESTTASSASSQYTVYAIAKAQNVTFYMKPTDQRFKTFSGRLCPAVSVRLFLGPVGVSAFLGDDVADDDDDGRNA